MSYIGTEVNINLSALYSEIFGYVGVPAPALNVLGGLTNNQTGQLTAAKSILNSFKNSPQGFAQIMHVTMTTPDFEFTFPYQPVLGLKSRTKIIRRYPNSPSATNRGSIKERWCEEDTEITLKGVFMDAPVRVGYGLDNYEPVQDFSQDMQDNIDAFETLRTYKGSVGINNRLLELLGITHMAIESAEWEMYPSVKVRPFIVKGYSDFPQYDLLE